MGVEVPVDIDLLHYFLSCPTLFELSAANDLAGHFLASFGVDHEIATCESSMSNNLFFQIFLAANNLFDQHYKILVKYNPHASNNPNSYCQMVEQYQCD